MLQPEETVRQIIEAGISQHRFEEDVDVFHELPSAVIEAAVDALGQGCAHREFWRSDSLAPD